MRVLIFVLATVLSGCSAPGTPTAISTDSAEDQAHQIAELNAKTEELEGEVATLNEKVEALEADQGDTAEDENLPQRVSTLEQNQANHGW